MLLVPGVSLATPGPSVSVADVSAVEGDDGNTMFAFTVTLSDAVDADVKVSYATANGTARSNSDYNAARASLVFAAGETSKTIFVTVRGDITSEPDEVFFLKLSNPRNAAIDDGQAIGTILNDDGAGLFLGDVTVGEGDSGTTMAVFTIGLTSPAATEVTFDVATADGTAFASAGDYVAASLTGQTIPVGSQIHSFAVVVNGDTTFEPDETFLVDLDNVTGAALVDGQGVGTIVNDDPEPGGPALSIGDVSIAEGDAGSSLATFTVTLSPASPNRVRVDFATADGTAIGLADYLPTSGRLTFPRGVTSQTVTVEVLGDVLAEPTETILVNLSNPVNAGILDGQGVGSVLDGDNAAPVAASQSVSTDEDHPLLITLSATDAESDPLTFSIASDPDHGDLDSPSTPDCTTTPGTCTATVTYTPDSDFVGTDGFTFTANDGLTDSAPATVSITVEEDLVGTTPSISADGRFVAFRAASGGISQIWVHDRELGTTQLVSRSTGGAAGNTGSVEPVISGDGRYVAFKSFADNLVANDTNGTSNVLNGGDVFVHDRQTSTTTRVSVSSAGVEGDGSSGGEGNAISADGRFVVFWSAAANLVAGDTNGIEDVFVHDRDTATTTRMSVATGGAQQTGSLQNLERGAAISGDGRYVVFLSLAADLVASDTNGWADVFMHDRQTGATTRVSVASDGTQGNQHSFDPAISADGRYVTFTSSASNLVANDNNPCNPPNVECSVPTAIDVFVRDTQTNTTTLVSKATNGTQANHNPSSSCRQLAISADGRFVAFCSSSTNLVAGDTNNESDIFVHDRQTAETTRVSVATNGTQSNDSSHDPVMSADGRYVGFWSWSNILSEGDPGDRSPDVFVHDRQTAETTRIT